MNSTARRAGLACILLLWILEYYGHKRVSVLDGGAAAWKEFGGDFTKALPVTTACAYRAKPDVRRIATLGQVKAWLKSQEVVFLDTRPEDEFAAGHLPGAFQMDWVALMRGTPPSTLKSAPVRHHAATRVDSPTISQRDTAPPSPVRARRCSRRCPQRRRFRRGTSPPRGSAPRRGAPSQAARASRARRYRRW